MKLEDLKREYEARYDNQAYANAPEYQALLELLRAATRLGPAAQKQFVDLFDFEYALDGVVKVGKRARLYPELMQEAATVGITII